MLRWNEYPEASSEVILEEIDGKAVIVNLRTGDCYTANTVSTFILRLCDGTRSLKDITKEVSAYFGVGHERAQRDTTSFFKHLLKEDLIRVANFDLDAP